MKIFYRYFLIIVLAIMGFVQNANASHIAGGDWNYQHISGDSFLLTLTLFRDCFGISMPTSVNIQFNSDCGNSFSQTFQLQNPGGTEVSQLCSAQITQSTCNGGSLPGMQSYIYSKIVELPSNCNDWTFSWSTCCRNAAILNLTGASGASFYLESTLNNAAFDTNSSPFFNATPIPYVCNGQLVNYNFGVTENDGDSIVYSFVDPLEGAALPVTWNGAGGYSLAFPLGTTVPITINQSTGQLTFTPNLNGNFVIAVQACEYEYGTGILKGCVTRDIQFVVQSCTNTQPTPPTNGFSNVTGDGLQIAPDSIEVCVGNSISFQLEFSDSDTADSMTLVSNVANVLPGAQVVYNNGNPAIMTVTWLAVAGSPQLNSFAVNVFDDSCPIPGLSTTAYNVVVVPSTYAGADRTICQGTQWADFSAVGGTIFTWSVITGDPIDSNVNSPGYNTTCWNCQDPSFSPNVTTTYEVLSNLSGTCKNRDTVTVNVAPNFNILMPNDTLICSVDDFQILMDSDEPTFTYSYQWAPSSTLDNDTVQQPICNPVDPTSYRVTVSSAGGCVKTDDILIDLSPPFPGDMEILGDTVLCFGSSTQLDLDYGPVPVGSCGPTTQQCLGNVIDGTVGTGTTTSGTNSFPSIYGGSRWSAKHQILYRANELQAMGMANGGIINSIAFDVASVGVPNVFNDFEIKIGCVSEVDLSNGWVSPSNLTTVYTSPSQVVNAGWNTHTFNTSYKWDGSSSVVVEICFANVGSSANTTHRYTSTGYQSVIYYSANNNSVCGSYPSPTNTFNAGFSAQRPNTRFNFCAGVDPTQLNYSWTPAAGLSNSSIPNPVAGPTSSTNYQLVVWDNFGGCSDTLDYFVDVVTQFNAGFTYNDPYCVSDAVDTPIVNVGGGYFTGNGIIDSAGTFDPAIAGIGTHAITHHIPFPSLCANDSTINVIVVPLPDASFDSEERCEGSAPFALNPAVSGGKWISQYVDSVTGVFDPTGLPPGIYTVYHELQVPCYNMDTGTVKIIEPYLFTIDTLNPTVCQGTQKDFSSNYTLNPGPLQGSGPVKAYFTSPSNVIDTNGLFDANGIPSGNYVVYLTISGLDGTCGTTDSFNVQVLQVDIPQFSGGLAFCDNESNGVINVTPGLFSDPNGTSAISYTQTPLGSLGANDTLDIIEQGASYPKKGRFNPKRSPYGEWLIEVTYTNNNGCTGVNSDTVKVLETPEAPEPKDKDFCERDIMILEATSDNVPNDSIYWYSDQALDSLENVGSPYLAGRAPSYEEGPHIVYLTANNDACVSPVTAYTLPIKKGPEAAFTMTFTDTSGLVRENVPNSESPVYGYTPFYVAFTAANYTAGKDSVVWNHRFDIVPADPSGMNYGNSSAGYTYTSSNIDENGVQTGGPFICQLQIYNEFGCADTAFTELYSVASASFYNIFTPNGDGENDVFYLPVFGVENYKAEVFNRWGQKVYEWNNPSEGWDGKDMPDGVYFWVVTGKKGDDSDYKKSGTVTISGSGN